MKIELQGIGKRYKLEWILRGIDLTIPSEGRVAITGPNGSGKSTLMKMLSGYLSPSKGSIQFTNQDQAVAISDLYHHLSYAAPYIDLIEELTLLEAIRFHQQFKPLLPGMDTDGIYQLLGFKKAKRKQIRHFSSGMKQRLKLVLAFCSDTPLLLLDEPTTNLDVEGMQWYRSLIDRFANDRTLIIASNVDVDFDFCEQRVDILDYKQ
jgi:ABC-type multidrug transport system ATPase subunit